MNNNRQQVSVPILGLDTSTTDTQVKDGAMQELHNLRYSGDAWRDIKPFLKKNRAQLLKTPNLITVSPDGTVTAQYPIAMPLIVVQATWMDVDDVHTTTTTTSIPQGATTAQIEVKYDILTGVSISSPAGDDPQYAYYSQFDEIPKVAINNAIAPNKIVGVYQHPADEKDIYLIVSKEDYEDGASIYRVQIKEGRASVLQGIGYYGGNFTISHFGKILIVTNITNKKIHYYYLNNSQYNAFKLPSPPIVRQAKKLSTSKELIPSGEYSYIKPFETFTDDSLGKDIHAIKLYSSESDIFAIPTFHPEDTFWGEICYFAVFKTKDGELIAQSALNISSSEPLSHGKSGMTFYYSIYQEARKFNIPTLYGDGDIYIKDLFAKTNIDHVFPWSFAISPMITISIDPNIDYSLLDSVQIYSTRVHPIWDIKKLKLLSERRAEYRKTTNAIDTFWLDYMASANDLFADNKLPEQPFYPLKTIPINEFSPDGKYTMYITAELLRNIEAKTVYQSLDAHQIFFENAKEYNNRVHTIGTLTTTLFEGYGRAWLPENSEQLAASTTEVSIDNQSFFARCFTPGSLTEHLIPNKILSYPDYRAKYIYNDPMYGQERFELQEAIENNFAYAVNDKEYGEVYDFFSEDETIDTQINNVYARKIVKYSAYFSTIAQHHNRSSDEFMDKSTYMRNNVMRVSAPNNPFVFPLANTYAIGTEENEIITVNSAAIELSDTKIGEFPLYVFTKEGIWVMRLGSGDVLYDFNLPRFYDQAINPDTLAVNANLLYITSRGLHALHSSGTSLISEALNDQFNVPELDFWKTAHLTHQPKYEEVIVYNLDKDESGNAKWPNAYVFSLGNQTWSTRNWVSGSEKLFQTPSRDIVLIDDLFRVFDCNEEHRNEGDTSTIRLVSRPIKLGSMEFKRMETLIPRIEVDAVQPLRITIEASSDLVSWVTLREISTLTSNHTLTIRRTSCSARYFRISLEVDVTHNFALSGFDMEYYLRFLRRLR